MQKEIWIWAKLWLKSVQGARYNRFKISTLQSSKWSVLESHPRGFYQALASGDVWIFLINSSHFEMTVTLEKFKIFSRCCTTSLLRDLKSEIRIFGEELFQFSYVTSRFQRDDAIFFGIKKCFINWPLWMWEQPYGHLFNEPRQSRSAIWRGSLKRYLLFLPSLSERSHLDRLFHFLNLR